MTQSLCALMVRLHSPDWASQSLMDLSVPPEERLVKFSARQRTAWLCPTSFRTHRIVWKSSVLGPIKKHNSASSSRPRPARKIFMASCVSWHKRTIDTNDRSTSSSSVASFLSWVVLSLVLVTTQSGLLSSASASCGDLFIHLCSSSQQMWQSVCTTPPRGCRSKQVSGPAACSVASPARPRTASKTWRGRRCPWR